MEKGETNRGGEELAYSCSTKKNKKLEKYLRGRRKENNTNETL